MDIIYYACGRGENPENSLEAIAHCQEVNPQRRVEMDLQLTKDGEIVLFHDDDTIRITGEDQMIKDLSLREARSFNIGHHFNSDNKSKPIWIPTLEEVFACFPDMKYLLDVHTDQSSIVPKLIGLIEKYLETNQIVLVSEYDAILDLLKQKRPDWTYGAATNEAKRLVYSSFLLADSLFPMQSDILMIPEYHGNIKVLTSRIVRHVKNRGKLLWVWKKEGDKVETVESIEDIKRYESMGVDAVFTSYPELVDSENSR